MHDLTPKSALPYGPERALDGFTLSETPLCLASLAARRGRVAECEAALTDMIGALPGVGRVTSGQDRHLLWTGAGQWTVCGHDEDLPHQIKALVGGAGSVTEQSGAWVALDLRGQRIADLVERLCNVPIRSLPGGSVRRTTLHHLGVFLWTIDTDHLRILGPRSSAADLWHAITLATEALPRGAS